MDNKLFLLLEDKEYMEQAIKNSYNFSFEIVKTTAEAKQKILHNKYMYIIVDLDGIDRKSKIMEVIPELFNTPTLFLVDKPKDLSKLDSLSVVYSPTEPFYDNKRFEQINKMIAVFVGMDDMIKLSKEKTKLITNYL